MILHCRKERLLFSFRELPLAAVRAARGTDGVCAARITDTGVVAIVEEDKTDSAIRAISAAYKEAAGRSAGISVVK